VIDVTDTTFEEHVLHADVPVLVDFTAPWCRPCRAIEPFLVDLEREHLDRLRLVRIDVDENLAVPGRYGVLSLPTVIVFVDGEPVETILGLHPRRRYVEAAARALGGAP
jgi:thioredoxin 1